MRGGDTSLGGPRKDFSETVWGMVQRACDTATDVRQDGLEELCRIYWKPVYHYLRLSWAKSNEDAKDLTQAFFLWLTDPKALRRFAPERASFRTFLKALLRHFVQHHDEALDRLKRGGGRTILDLDGAGAVVADSKLVDPERAFENEWRKELIARSVEDVRKRLLARGRDQKFRVFEEYYLSSAEGRPTYGAIAGRLGLKETDVQHSLVEVREEVRQAIRARLAQTTSDPGGLEEEWNAFFGS